MNEQPEMLQTTSPPRLLLRLAGGPVGVCGYEATCMSY